MGPPSTMPMLRRQALLIELRWGKVKGFPISLQGSPTSIPYRDSFTFPSGGIPPLELYQPCALNSCQCHYSTLANAAKKAPSGTRSFGRPEKRPLPFVKLFLKFIRISDRIGFLGHRDRGGQEGVLRRQGGSWGSLGFLGASWGGRLGAFRGSSWGDLGLTWGRLGAIYWDRGGSWGRRGASRALLGASWRAIGALLGQLGGDLGASWGLLRASWGLFGVSREPLGGGVGACGGVLGRPKVAFACPGDV